MSYSANRNRVRKIANSLGMSQSEASLASKVHDLTVRTLGDWGAVSPKGGDGAFGIESYSGTDIQRNTNFDPNSAGLEGFIKGLGELNMSSRHIEETAEACLSMFDKSFSKDAVIRPGEVTSGHMQLSQVVGRNVAAQYQKEENLIALESFGDDINRLSTDERVTMDLMIMRPYENIMDKNLARVNSTSPTVTMRIPDPQVYDWGKTQKTGSTIVDRFDNNTTPLRDLYRNPTPVNSSAKRIIPLDANDTNDVVFNEAQFLYKTGVDVSLMDVSRNAAEFANGATIDRSDLISDGGRLDAVVISLTSGATTEHFKLRTASFSTAGFTMSPSTMSSGQRQVILDCALPITATTKTYTGGNSTIAAELTDAKIVANIRVTATMDIKTGRLTAHGSVNLVLVDRNDVAGAISGDTQTFFDALVPAVTAYSVEVYFDEQNQRKANLAVWCNYKQIQFMVPRSRFYITEYALAQDADDNATAATSSVMALGNGRRGLDVIVDALNTVSEGLADAAANPEIASVNLIGDQSFASSLVKPTVIKTTIDFSDEDTVNVMNESTRMVEVHGRFRARMIQAFAQLMANSLMHNQYKGGETQVLKVWTHTTIADLIIGITDYHPTLVDKANVASGADYSFLLPNGARVDVVKSNLDCLKQRLYAIPVLESDPSNVVSAAHIRDCGSVSLNYAPTNAGSVVRRIASTTREMVIMTNHVGIMMEIVGLEDQYGVNTFGPLLLNADKNDAIAV